MTVTTIDKDEAAYTMRVVAEYDSPTARVWQLWADPRLLERWWGPPTWPATVEEHDLTPGGRVTYYMTGPDGEKARGYWNVLAVDAPSSLDLEDGFADDSGTPNEELPVTKMHLSIEAIDGGSRMVITSQFASADAMKQLIAMGMEEGLREALGQTDALLTAA